MMFFKKNGQSPFIVEKKANILNYILHFLWKWNLCRCEKFSGFQLLLVLETLSDLPGFCLPVTDVLQGVPSLSKSAPEII